MDNRAIGYCTICGRAVCEECAQIYDNKFLCEDPDHKRYLQTWQVVHSFDFEYEAAMLYVNLDQQGIETQVFTKLNPNLEEAMYRPNVVEVRVPANRLEAAKKVLEMLGLGGEDPEDDE